MSKDNFKSNEYKVSFKPTLKISKIASLKRENPNLAYRRVRVDKQYDPYGELLDADLTAGWEVVYDSTGEHDDRASTKSAETLDGKSSPIVEEGKGNATFVWLCKPKEEWRKDEQERYNKDKSQAINSKGRTIKQKGSNLSITDPEVNAKNINDN